MTESTYSAQGNGKLPSGHMTPGWQMAEPGQGDIGHWTGIGIVALAEHQAGSLAEAPSGLPKAFFLTVTGFKVWAAMDL